MYNIVLKKLLELFYMLYISKLPGMLVAPNTLKTLAKYVNLIITSAKFYSCGLSTATIEYSPMCVCVCVCVCVCTRNEKEIDLGT